MVSMPKLTRRCFLKSAGMSSLMLAASPLAAFQPNREEILFLNIFPFHPFEDERTCPKRPRPPIKVGDTIRFLPKLRLDGYVTIDEPEDFLNHIILY